MNLLYPLGFLGLLGLIVLLIIYILKPNYQQKFVSSTHVWKLSLKYKRKRLPISKLTNLLIIICQILIISFGAVALARPFLVDAVEPPRNETIVIIDASASMMAHQGDGETRFERAVTQARAFGHAAIGRNELITVILAESTARILPGIVRTDNIEILDEAMDILIEPDSMGLPSGGTFGTADIDGAMALAEGYLMENPLARVMLYTATTFENTGSVIVVDVSRRDIEIYGDNAEWNAAILNAQAVFEDNAFRFVIEVASFNRDANIPVFLMAYGVNGDDPSVAMSMEPAQTYALCIDNQSATVNFAGLGINSFSSVHIFIEADDSFAYDNHFWLFGGRKETLRIIYVSPAPSDFYIAVLSSLPIALASRWNISFEITTFSEIRHQEQQYGIRLGGFDLYIFEYEMPDVLPSDGASFLIVGGPSLGFEEIAPRGSGLVFGERIDRRNVPDPENNYLHPGAPSQLLNFINPSNIMVSHYRQVSATEDFTALMYFREFRDGREVMDPVLLLQNTQDTKVAVMAYASFFSNFAISVEFPTLLFNLLEVFFPPTTARHVYEIGESLVFDQSDEILSETRPVINMTHGIENRHFFAAPYNIPLMSLGTHTMSQMLISGRIVSEDVFVRVSATESDFTRIATFAAPNHPEPPRLDYDIYIFLAAALLSLLFFERLLAMKKSA